MISYYAIVHTNAPMAFYSNDAVLDFLPDLNYKRLISVPRINGSLSIGQSENASAQIAIDNGDWAVSGLISEQPIMLKKCGIYSVIDGIASLEFEGVIQAIALSKSATITIEV